MMPASPHPFPTLYFNSGIKMIDSSDNAAFVRNDYLSGTVKGETGIEGLRLDFNAGLRLEVPSGNWHVRITDADSELVFFDYDVSEKTLISMEQFFIRWRIEVSRDGEPVFSHTYDATDQEVCFVLQPHVVGDNIMFLPYIASFAQKHRCRAVVVAGSLITPLMRELYPELTPVLNVSENTYATYDLRNFQKEPFWESDNSRSLPYAYIGRLLLGLDFTPRPRVFTPSAPRLIKEPYVTIAVQGSGTLKSWLYPGGWETVVDYLKELGYRVLCIDRAPAHEDDSGKVVMPANAEDFTGDRSLVDRLHMIHYADFFIGISSGLTWLAEAAGTKAIIISGITMPHTEYDTPYRVINRLVCHGCYNDLRVDWKAPCPRHQGTPREGECSRKIHPKQVIEMIDRLRRDLWKH